MKKKVLAMFVAICLCVLCVVPANALSEDSKIDEVMTPNYLYTAVTSTHLSISSGTASISASINGIMGTTTRTQVYAYLEKYVNGSWTSLYMFYASADTFYCDLFGYYSVPSGYSYRVRASYYAYAGSAYENIVAFSNTV
ncbi:MAG: hypothetical protein K0S55_1759, partial [Clostridia bacterium]|nr:hypothetical protein [Clostridia bacterium]